MKKGLADKIFIGLCIGLIVMCAISAVGFWMDGMYKDMHNSLNWVLWIGNTIMMSLLLRRQEVEIEVKDDYIKSLEEIIKSLEEYKTLSDDHAVSMKDLYQAQKAYSKELEGQIDEYKELTADYNKLVEEYKNAKPSRF